MSLPEQALLWLDADRARFWTAAWLVFGGTVFAALRPVRPGAPAAARRANAALFACAVCATLAAFRWPVWFYPQELNPDEAQIVAGAITLEQYPVYWKYVDGTTHGPVLEYLLVAAHRLGAPLDYGTARVIGTLLQAGALLATWGTLRRFTTEALARGGILPALAFWAFATWDDVVHYSTELPGVCLLAVAGWLIALVLTAAPERPRLPLGAALAGLCLGLVPFAKLQSVPQAAVLAAVALALGWRATAGQPAPVRWRLAGSFVGGGLLPSAALVVFLGVYGLWEHFRASYLLSALDYVRLADNRPAEMPMRFLHFSATEPAFACLLWGSLAFTLLYARTAAPDRNLRWGRAAAALLLAAAWYCVIRPGREVVHYLHLLVIPVTTLAGLSLAIAVPESAARPAGWRRAVPALLFALLTLVPLGYNRIAGSRHRFVGSVAGYRQARPSPAATFLRAHARPGDTVAMWGWEPHLLVETGLPHGTREAHTANQIMDWPLRSYYVTRYLWDMERRQPEWFVDVVGPGSFAFETRSMQAHETVPALRELIATRYELAAEFGNRRIYRRKAPPHPG